MAATDDKEMAVAPPSTNLPSSGETEPVELASVHSTSTAPDSPRVRPTETDAESIGESQISPATYPPSTVTATVSERELARLPPMDRGRAAYQFLASAFVVEFVVWGMPSSYGVFLSYYQKEGVAGSKSGAGLLPLVGAVASGTLYLLGPPVALLINPRPHWRLWAIRLGSLTCALALLFSSFAKTPYQLLLTQGLMYSVGGSLAYYPTFSFLSEWFVARRGFANGVCFAGTAGAGLVYPFLLDWLLRSYGPARALQVSAILSAVLFGAALPFLRPRLPIGQQRLGTITPRHHPSSIELPKKKLWKDKRVWVFMLANVAQALGYFLPTLYLPTFGSALGLSGEQGSGLLACVNGAAVLSRVGVGILSDRHRPHRIGAIVMTASSASVLILWGTATSLAPLLAFSLILGLVAGGWTSLYASIVRDLAKDDPQLATTVFGLLSFTRGIGSLLTAPLSTYLIAHPLHGASSGYGIKGGEYGSLIITAGVALSLAAIMEVAVSI